MSSSKTPVASEPVNERNWYDKMNAAEKAHPFGQQWRKQFTAQELEIIDRAMESEFQWAGKDLPGPRRFDVIDD